MRSAALPGALSVLKGQRRRRESGSVPGSPPPQIPAPAPSGRSSGAGRRGLDPRGSERGGSGLAEGGMEGTAPANGEAAPRGGANQSKDAEEAATNQQRDQELAVANGEALPQGSSSEGKRSCGSANEDTEPRELTNDSEEPQAANQDTGHKSRTNQDTGHKSSTSEYTGHKSPSNPDTSPSTNQDTAPPAPTNKDTAPAATANENSPRQAPPNQDTPPQDPSNDLAPLPAAANQAPDPWDWSLEEAWLRAPEEEGLDLWGAGPEGQGVDLEHQGVELESEWAELEAEWAEPGAAAQPEAAAHWWSSPDGAWSKLIVRPGRGLARPGPGSRCRVLLTAPSCGRWGPVSAASGSGRWRSVRLGSAEGRWSRLLDAALETMAGGELARIRVAAAAGAVTVTVQLGHFTAPPPFWASPSSSRWRSVTSGHARACALLAQGLLSAAGQAYSRALRAAILAGGPGPLSAEVSGVKAELHAGLALVQLRLGLPAAAAANAGKALALRPAHLEARYRRGVAQAAMMDLEAAMADLVAVLRAQPGHAGARRELRRVRGAARERDARLARRLGRLFA